MTGATDVVHDGFTEGERHEMTNNATQLTQLQNERDFITSKIATYRNATVQPRWEDMVALEIVMVEIYKLKGGK